ncbi:hypothetical protein [Epilithonimonas lactis]|uniref:Uncharacterized protein n=1 Tax=Epilithonimonas lactis TaxID=421072 RepID=A0A085BJU0_9FLAO|nr:hypothetical protein [Epilithonimonas lactis]KFC22735.1 hypothetical protein IO89_06690 [Epilithonimonas lactis]SEQ85818.1 hypothetical protein SAMN04488097_3256 [Epilithonimonas lactis]
MRGILKGLFQSKISINQIKEIERKLIQQLTDYDENFEITNKKMISEISNIYFSFEPKGISILREVRDKEAYRKLQRLPRHILNINGIEFYNTKRKIFENIPCSFSNYQLTFILHENPKIFHKIFDINNIRLRDLIIKTVNTVNPDKEVVEKILNLYSSEEIEKLDLENCFEIEFDSNKYYTILDLENGDYIGVDRKGKIYYLNHDAEIRVKEIFENLSEFLKNYNGNLNELEKFNDI